MADNNNVSNENLNVLPTEDVITDIKFGNNTYEIGLGEGTREAIEGVFSDIDYNFTRLNTTIEENEEIVSSSLNDLEERKADKVDIPTVPTNVSAFTNDAGYLTQHQDLSSYFNGVEYDSQTKHINFKNGNTVNAYIDATNFIKDGMVDNVEIKEVTIQGVAKNCLVITFNTDSGKEDINLELSEIFEPNDYYTKEEIEDIEKAIALSLIDLDERKLDAANLNNYYTKAESDAKYLTQADGSDCFNDVEINTTTNRINFKNGDTVKKYIDTTDIFDPDDYYTKDDIDNADIAVSSALNELNEKVDGITIPQVTNSVTQNSTDAVTSGAVYKVIADNEKVVSSALNELYANKVDKTEMPTNVSTFTNDAGYFNDVAIDTTTGRINFKDGNTIKKYIDTTDIFDPDDYYDKDYVDGIERVAAAGLADLNANKADRSEIPTNVSTFTNDAGYLVSSDISGKADKTPIVNHGTSDTTFELTPNVYHQWGEVASLTLTLGSAASGYLAEYMFEFTSGSTATTLSLPAAIKWQIPLSVEANKIYQVSIVNNIGIIIGVNS